MASYELQEWRVQLAFNLDEDVYTRVTVTANTADKNALSIGYAGITRLLRIGCMLSWDGSSPAFPCRRRKVAWS